MPSEAQLGDIFLISEFSDPKETPLGLHLRRTKYVAQLHLISNRINVFSFLLGAVKFQKCGFGETYLPEVIQVKKWLF